MVFEVRVPEGVYMWTRKAATRQNVGWAVSLRHVPATLELGASTD